MKLDLSGGPNRNQGLYMGMSLMYVRTSKEASVAGTSKTRKMGAKEIELTKERLRGEEPFLSGAS